MALAHATRHRHGDQTPKRGHLHSISLRFVYHWCFPGNGAGSGGSHAMSRSLHSRGRLGTLLFGIAEGVLLASLVVNLRNARDEDAFFRSVAASAISSGMQPEERFLALLHKTHTMLMPLRTGIADGSIVDVSGLAHYRNVLFGSVATPALYPGSECGSFSGLLVKLLKIGGFPVRFVQMLDRDAPDGIAHHIIVEALVDGRWVVCDPLYDLVFRDADGRLLGFEEVHRDWPALKAQCPPQYDPRYDYAGVRRVNFGRFNAWLQRTPLAALSPRVWLNEGSWLRSGFVGSLLAAVVATHVWYERGNRAAAVVPVRRAAAPERPPVPVS